MSVALGLFRELIATTHLGPKNLHSYRIEVKRLRYVLEMAEEETGEQHRLIAKLKEVQDAIGEWHDWLELSGIARHPLQHQKNCRVMRKSLRLRTTNTARHSDHGGDEATPLRVTAEGRGTKFPDRVLVATSELWRDLPEAIAGWTVAQEMLLRGVGFPTISGQALKMRRSRSS